MISVIICSLDRKALELVKENIRLTIGVDHEIVAIDNFGTGKGICEVYNEGTALAKYDILCFMHEDIVIQTKDWGREIMGIFCDSTIGLLGVAGSTCRSLTPSGWFPPSEYGTSSWRLNMIQGSKYNNADLKVDYFNPEGEKLSRVACVDGVWFCTRKTIAAVVKFDNSLLKGFHGYDIDYSLGVSKLHRVMVTFNILLQHKSEGNFDIAWLKEMVKVQNKYKDILPVNYDTLNLPDFKNLERKSSNRFLRENIKKNELNKSELHEVLSMYFQRNQISLLKYIKFLFKILLR